MGRPAGWSQAMTGRALMRSPGRPPVRRDMEREFWRHVAAGVTSEQAGVLAGASGPVGSRWFRERGGMATFLSESAGPLSGRYLSFTEREELALARARGAGVREIARQLGRSPSTISRELRRNAATRGGKLEYRASVAQWKAERAAARPKTAKLVTHPRLRAYVQERLSGKVRRPDGRPVPGPSTAAFAGRNKPRRQDRRWGKAWSPEQISARLRLDFPDDPTMRISHEAIYQALFVRQRGALDRELVAFLRTGRALRVPRARSRRRASGHVTENTTLDKRPRDIEDRMIAGDWEGDLIIGLNRSAIATLVERTTRYTILVHLPRLDGYGEQPRRHNGPALSGYGAQAAREAITARMSVLPARLRRTLTWDRGKELAQHAQLRQDTGLSVYFADPHSPWQRGTNENTNGLMRQYFPKGTDLARWSASDLEAVEATVNDRPRKTLDWRSPMELFEALLSQSLSSSVATTG